MIRQSPVNDFLKEVGILFVPINQNISRVNLLLAYTSWLKSNYCTILPKKYSWAHTYTVLQLSWRLDFITKCHKNKYEYKLPIKLNISIATASFGGLSQEYRFPFHFCHKKENKNGGTLTCFFVFPLLQNAVIGESLVQEQNNGRKPTWNWQFSYEAVKKNW